MLRLVVLSGADAGKRLDSADDLVRVGRADTANLVLSEVHVSGDHAHIAFAGDRYLVRDTGSTNGTRIERLGGVHEVSASLAGTADAELKDGDVLLVGDRERPVRIQVAIGDDDAANIVSVRAVSDLSRVEQEVGADANTLRALYESQKQIAGVSDLDEVITVVAERVFEFISRATHVTLALREDESGPGAGRYVPVGSRVRGGATPEPIPVTRSVVKKVVSERAAVLAADAKRDVGETASLMSAQILSTIGLPLWHGDEIIGVLQVDNRGSTGVLRERDLDVLAVLSQAASQAVAHARLVQRLRVAEERQRKENTYLKRREETRRGGEIIGQSSAMKSVFEQLRKVVDTRVTVLVEGETGVGKELIASAVHYWSNRRDRMFVAQNCAALPENLLESELFGHKKGSFTGATDDKKGLFEIADGGTLFLDEVTEMPLSLQAKLLRAIQEGEIRQVGSNTTKRVDVRIVAATNRDLEGEVKAGRFREDLFYRLRVFPIRVPPLRERREDVPLLAAHFLTRYAREFGKPVAGFSQQASELMRAYDWPGNVRELENEVQRLVIQLDPNGFVQPEHLSQRVRRVDNVLGKVQPTKGTLREMVDQVEKWILLEALREHDNNKSATAKSLGITREGLHKKLKSLGIG